MIKLYRRITMIIKLIFESIRFAFGSLKGDKFRTFLSLFGVSIGIFSIVTVFTAVGALQKNVESGLNSFGGNTVYVQQFPFAPPEGEEYKWWEYMNRPMPKYEEYLFLKSQSKTIAATSFVVFTNRTVTYKRASFNSGFITAATYEWGEIANIEIDRGRYFSQFEAQSSTPVVILGNEVANALFGFENPINKVIKVGNANARVIGVQKKAGESIVNIFDTDNSILISYTFASTIMNVKRTESMICIKPIDGVDRDESIQEMRQLLRSIRRLKPKQNDNFALNEMTFLLSQTKAIFGGINLAGWIIGGFSILIGGFGIANIMFVSVKERTNLIGIQKALGAKKYIILTQFLAEAAALALAGGAIGILMVLGVVLALHGNESFPMELTAYNVFRGLFISSIIGIVAGLLPAYTAANLNPVEAINSK
ncbi:MAG: ABC transporter permease [Bacteroidales bacterium]|nr:ABC transporter permease [Bacteroidales bacterium]MDD2280303.1 ABC transporter permease [Bacteroidales bacterium]MDD4492090.1 ABC transporter permease [Bacteroidales bacterium]HNW48288.1 ABC transporter permease [Bacteroidales bacterium]